MTGQIIFGAYRLDPDGRRLWKGDALVPLQPRPFAVLAYLAARPGVAVGRDELIRSLWAGTFVTKAVLKVAVRAIREALGDDVDSPRYIETVGREGYRFIGGAAVTARPVAGVAPRTGRAAIVGRARDVATLRTRLAQAVGGVRTVVFVTGEAGIGKTSVVDGFLEEVAKDGSASIARGQCLEQYGEGEAYLPVLDAIGRLARDDRTGEIAAALGRHAPTWVSQIPALETTAPSRSRAGQTIAPTPARMLREMADALDDVTRRRALVLVLEDLQWSDRSTIDLVGFIARLRQPARLMLLGTFRAADAIVQHHPIRALAQELHASGHAETIALELLAMDDVATYLGTRFSAPASDSMRRLAARIHERTEGNPLFMVNLVNDLVAARLLVWEDGRWRIDGSVENATERVPSVLRDLLARRVRHVAGVMRRALEAASVAGDEFAVASVAAAADADAEAVEDLCEALAAQETVIADAGVAEWPDGSVSGRYRFSHALYRQVLYEGIGEARRARLHRAIGLREEAAFGARAGERAAQLAMHFERGRDHARALDWHERAASAALERQAAHEAAAHFAAALDALSHQPEGPQRDERELRLLVTCATLAVRGYAAPLTDRAFARARALCDALPPGPKLYALLRGLVSYHHARNELATAHEFGELLLRHAARDADDRALRVQAHYAHGVTVFHEGVLDAAREHLELALAAYDPTTHRAHITTYGGYDPGVGCSLWLAWTLAMLGRLDEAVDHDRAGVALARRLAHPLSLALAAFATSVSRQMFGEWAECGAAAGEAARLAEEHGFRDLHGMATTNQGLALVMRGDLGAGLPLLRDGVAAAIHATGGAVVRPAQHALLAFADSAEGNWEAAGRRLDEGFVAVERTGERVNEPLLHIGRGHVLAALARPDAAEESFRRAIAVARAQGARLMELSAAVALARLCRSWKRPGDALAVLNIAHAPFETVRILSPDVVAARELLAEKS